MLKTLNDRVFAVYGVTPHAEFKDVYVVLIALFALFAIRFIVSGVNCGGSNPCPSLFTYIIDKFKLAKDKKSYKLAESFWYLCWHVTSLTCTIAVLCEEYGTADNRKWLYYFLKDTKGICMQVFLRLPGGCYKPDDHVAARDDDAARQVAEPHKHRILVVLLHIHPLGNEALGHEDHAVPPLHDRVAARDQLRLQLPQNWHGMHKLDNCSYRSDRHHPARHTRCAPLLHQVQLLPAQRKHGRHSRRLPHLRALPRRRQAGAAGQIRGVPAHREDGIQRAVRRRLEVPVDPPRRDLVPLPARCPHGTSSRWQTQRIFAQVMNIYWLNLIIGMIRGFAKGEVIEDTREKDD
ncbi:longevity-assurance protein (LAG1) domain-containing protein [Babesia caballi]|uniref:Longevity-assurance protein (LAG1) domain-containing protein n=1 Tax=Babesia caballi TaxID=5871 RepID=A0AAV4LPH7_BABCB|nr:longevity-assurance protein (LAG1) domain-containing protein [Babesia caballi]